MDKVYVQFEGMLYQQRILWILMGTNGAPLIADSVLFCYERGFISKQNWEMTKGYSLWKFEKRHGKFWKTGLNNWSISKSQKAGLNQESGRIGVPCLHVTLVANALLRPLDEGEVRYQSHGIGGKSHWMGWHCNRLRVRMSFYIRDRETSYCWIRSPYRPLHFMKDNVKRS